MGTRQVEMSRPYKLFWKEERPDGTVYRSKWLESTEEVGLLIKLACEVKGITSFVVTYEPIKEFTV